MKKQKEKKQKKKKREISFIIKCSGILLLVLLLLLLAAFLWLHSYLGKINYQKSGMENGEPGRPVQEEIPEESPEDQDASLQDSAAEEIAALEERLQEQTSGMEELVFDEDVFNILLIGYDSRDKNSRGRSDTNILVSVNRDTREITMTSIMRDSYVAIPGHGNNRINAAYAYGGSSLLVETVEKNLQVSVDHYAAVNFYSFMDIIDMIDGVDIEVSDAEAEVMNRYIRELNRLEGCGEETDRLDAGGMLHLNGKQALAYTRVRYVGNADFERTQRQRTVLEKTFEKAKEMNLLELSRLLERLLPEISTDMSEREILFFLLQGTSFFQYDLKSLRVPADGTYEALRINGMEVLGIDLEKNRALLKEEVYGSGQD